MNARRVVLALARVEAPRLVRHPSFLVGVALVVMMVMLGVAVDHGSMTWNSDDLALTLVFMGWAAIVAGNLAALRSRRSGTDELLAAYPTSEATRTLGLLASAPAVGSVAALLVAVAVAVQPWRLRGIGGLPAVARVTGLPDLWLVATGITVVIGGVVVGTFMARWAPYVGFGYIALFIVTILQGTIGSGTVGNRKLYLAFLRTDDTRVIFDWSLPPKYATHLLYLLGWMAIVAVGAVSRRRLTRAGASVGAVAVVVVVITAVIQLQPLSPAEASTRASSLADPAWVCSTLDGVAYCAYPGEEEHIDAWAATVGRVQAVLPAQARRPERLEQRIPWVVEDSDCAPRPFTSVVPAEVAAELDPGRLWPQDGVIHPTLGEESEGCTDTAGAVGWMYLAVQIGSYAVGLPPADHSGGQRCEADGQARSVVALWAGATATDQGDRLVAMLWEDRVMGAEHLDFVGNGPVLDRSGWSVPPPWGTRFLRSDAAAAVALLGLPPEQVRDALAAHWDEIVDPATPAAAVLGWAGAGTGAEAAASPAALVRSASSCV